MLCSKPPPSHLWKLYCAGSAHSHAECFPWGITVCEFECMNEILLSFSQAHAFERHLLDKGTGRGQKMQHQLTILPQLTAKDLSGKRWLPASHGPAAHAHCQGFSCSWSNTLTAPGCTPAVSHQKGTIFLHLSDALQRGNKMPQCFFVFQVTQKKSDKVV